MAPILVMWPGPNIQAFFPPLLKGCMWNLNEIGLLFLKEQPFENVKRQLTCELWPKSANDLNLENCIGGKCWCIMVSKSTIATKIALFQLFPFKSLRGKNWLCHTISQGQLKVIIYINSKGLTPQMLHTIVVSGMKSFENVDDWRRTDNGGYHPISFPAGANDSGEIINNMKMPIHLPILLF